MKRCYRAENFRLEDQVKGYSEYSIENTSGFIMLIEIQFVEFIK